MVGKPAVLELGMGTGNSPPAKKRGTTLWTAGLTFGFNSSSGKSYNKPFGVIGSFSYEVDHFRVEVSARGEHREPLSAP